MQPSLMYHTEKFWNVCEEMGRNNIQDLPVHPISSGKPQTVRTDSKSTDALVELQLTLNNKQGKKRVSQDFSKTSRPCSKILELTKHLGTRRCSYTTQQKALPCTQCCIRQTLKRGATKPRFSSLSQTSRWSYPFCFQSKQQLVKWCQT